MVETSEIQRGNNLGLIGWVPYQFGAKATSDIIENLDQREPEVHFTPVPLGTHGSIIDAVSFFDCSWAEDPAFSERSARQLLSAKDIWWVARHSIERGVGEPLQHRFARHQYYDPSLEDSILEKVYDLQTRDGNQILPKAAPISAGALVENWAMLFQDLTRQRADTADAIGRSRLAARLKASFEVDPVEDGVQHPAEDIVSETFESAEAKYILDWLESFCLDSSSPSFAASILRCLGRDQDIGTASWRVRLVRNGLTMQSVEIRDAAVQAAESWGDLDLLEVLNSHADSEPWLQQYVCAVIEDLTV